MKQNQKELRRCEVEGCSNPHLARGYCNKHYKRVQTHGSPHAGTYTARFYARVEKNSATGCWEWTGRRNDSGYGLMQISRKIRRATHVIWHLEHGEWPSDLGLHVCHKCDNPGCVNPTHLFLGTPADNMRDASKKGRCRTTPRRGKANANTKFSAEQVRLARRLYAKGYRQVDIASRLGISQPHVSSIVRRVAWAHLAETPAEYERRKAQILRGATT